MLVPVLVVAALPLVENPTRWASPAITALAMGMLIFVIASGLTPVFCPCAFFSAGGGNDQKSIVATAGKTVKLTWSRQI